MLKHFPRLLNCDIEKRKGMLMGDDVEGDPSETFPLTPIVVPVDGTTRGPQPASCQWFTYVPYSSLPYDSSTFNVQR